MKYILTTVLSLFLISSASAAGQFGNSAGASGLVGTYANGLGGILKYNMPITIDGLDRSGLGVVAEGQIGAGINEDEFVMSSLVGANLVFLVSDDFDFYGGLGFGSRVLPDASIGPGGQVGINFVMNDRRLFVEAGSHPGAAGFLGLGLRL